MAEQTLLIIDPNPQQRNIIEVQLRQHDYEVIGAPSVARAEELIEVSPPDLIICEYQLGEEGSASALCKRLKSGIGTRSIPFMAIVDQDQQRVECLSEGADDILMKPIYMAELRDRAEMLLQRRRRLTLERGVGQRFFGRLEEMGLLDLMQVIEVSKRSGQLVIEHQSQRASVWFSEGVAHDAELGHQSGEDALQRLLTWEFGQYEFDFQAAPRPNKINQDLESIRSRGLSHVDQWHKMCEQLPSLQTVFRKDPGAINDRYEPLEPSLQSLIDIFDGQLTALEVINTAPLPDLEALQALTQLYFEGLVYEIDEPAPLDVDQTPAFLDASPAVDLPEEPVDAEEDDASTAATREATEEDFDVDGASIEIEPKPSELLAAEPLTQAPPPPMGLGEFAPPPPMNSMEMPPAIPEEGQDLLAELYATQSPEADPPMNLVMSPPPVPGPFPEESDTSEGDEAYSTLFGVGGEFAYSDEESAFFEQLEAEPSMVFGDEEKKPMSGGSKAFLWIALLAISTVTAYTLYDNVKPLEVSAMIQPDWVDINLHGRQLNPDDMSPAQGEWRLEWVDRAVAAAPIAEETTPAQKDQPRARAERADPTPKKRSGGKSFSKLMKSAIKLQRAEKFKKSAEVVSQALELKPSAPDALLLSAVCASELGQDRVALGHLQKLLRSKPEYGSKALGRGYGPGVVYNLIALTFNNLGDKASALKHYENYLRKYPSGIWSREIKSIVMRLKR